MEWSSQDESNVDWLGRWSHIDSTLLCDGPMSGDNFNIKVGKDNLRDGVRLLIIGAGGLGCELLKDLALMGFRYIDIIDMDTIDVSNLNRQFLFRSTDVGKAKAEVAAAFVRERVPGIVINEHFCKIQDKDEDFYREFSLVVCGLDSVPARRWINSMLVGLVEFNDDGKPDMSTVIPFVDGGTEGFKGQVRVIFPRISACFECTIATFPPQVNFPLCTLAVTPRLPEHCIEFAKVVLWPQEFPNECLDVDRPEHMMWIYERALERAKEHNIQGVTYRFTQGVVKNIIPAIASTNATVAAACAHEAFKLATSAWPVMENYMFINGGDGVYSFTFEYEKDPDCMVCSGSPVSLECSADSTLGMLRNGLADDIRFQMKEPAVRSNTNNKSLYMPRPPPLEMMTRKNLDKTLSELDITTGHELILTDPAVPNPVVVTIVIQE